MSFADRLRVLIAKGIDELEPPRHAEASRVTWVLCYAGGWHVGSQTAEEHIVEIEEATARGWLTTRVHYAPIIPEGVAAYELTDAGLEHLRVTAGHVAALDASTMRDRYRAGHDRFKPKATP